MRTLQLWAGLALVGTIAVIEAAVRVAGDMLWHAWSGERDDRLY